MNGMSEQEVMEALDVTMSDEGEQSEPGTAEVTSGEEEEGVADLSGDDTPEGEEGQEVAEPASDKEIKDRDVIFASARRRAEAAARRKIAEAKRDADKRVSDAISSLGIKNPVTGKIATTEAELREARMASNSTEAAEKLKRIGISEELIKGMIDNHPSVVKAKELSDKLEKESRRADNAEYAARISKEIEKISKENPEIKSFDDVYALPEYEEIYRLSVQKGLSLSEAYRLATYDKHIERARAESRAQAKNEVGSKAHIKTSGGSKGTGKEVPASVLARMKELTPGLSDEEYKNFYFKQNEGVKK